jgi:hypothetical protein
VFLGGHSMDLQYCWGNCILYQPFAVSVSYSDPVRYFSSGFRKQGKPSSWNISKYVAFPCDFCWRRHDLWCSPSKCHTKQSDSQHLAIPEDWTIVGCCQTSTGCCTSSLIQTQKSALSLKRTFNVRAECCWHCSPLTRLSHRSGQSSVSLYGNCCL